MSHAITDVHRTVKSAERSVDILELLAEDDGYHTLSELQRSLGLPRSSLHGLLRTLTSRGWLETDARGTAYRIGLRALRIGAAYLEGDPTVQLAGPLLVRLRNELDETVHLARLSGPDIVYLASQESLHHLRSASRIGRRVPAHAASLGKVLLAERSPEEVAAVLPDPLPALTPETVVHLPDLLDELQEIRLRGWGTERGQSAAGLGCIAVTVPSQNPARDAISCSIPLARFSSDRIPDIVAALRAAADELARQLGPRSKGPSVT